MPTCPQTAQSLRQWSLRGGRAECNVADHHVLTHVLQDQNTRSIHEDRSVFIEFKCRWAEDTVDLPQLYSWWGYSISPFTHIMSTAHPWRASRRLRHNRVPTQRPTILNRDTDSSAYSPLSPDVRTYFWLASDTLILDFTAMKDAFLLTPGGFCSQVTPWPEGMEWRRQFEVLLF